MTNRLIDIAQLAALCFAGGFLLATIIVVVKWEHRHDS